VRGAEALHRPGRWSRWRFLEIFNVLNSNAEQNMNCASGPLFLRPLTIVPPRIARIGVRLDW